MVKLNVISQDHSHWENIYFSLCFSFLLHICLYTPLSLVCPIKLQVLSVKSWRDIPDLNDMEAKYSLAMNKHPKPAGGGDWRSWGLYKRNSKRQPRISPGIWWFAVIMSDLRPYNSLLGEGKVPDWCSQWQRQSIRNKTMEGMFRNVILNEKIHLHYI